MVITNVYNKQQKHIMNQKKATVLHVSQQPIWFWHPLTKHKWWINHPRFRHMLICSSLLSFPSTVKAQRQVLKRRSPLFQLSLSAGSTGRISCCCEPMHYCQKLCCGTRGGGLPSGNLPRGIQKDLEVATIKAFQQLKGFLRMVIGNDICCYGAGVGAWEQGK